MVTDGQTGLFGVEELAPLPNAGRAEAGLTKALEAAAAAELIQDVDAGMVAAALIGARVLDRAEALPDKTAVYAIAQALPPYMKALHALGIPLERAPAGGPATPVPTTDGLGATDWLGDALGPS